MNTSFVRASLIATPFILSSVVWYLFAIQCPIPFWQQTGDYSWYSLSHAFTLEAKISGLPAYNLGYNIHPAIPLEIVSWVALRISTMGLTDWQDRILFAAQNPESYWFVARCFSLAIHCGGLLLLYRLSRRSISAFLTGGFLYLGLVSAVFENAIIQLTTETFTLVYMVGIYGCFLSYLQACSPASEGATSAIPPTSFGAFGLKVDRGDVLAFAIGALTAVGASIKIYYLAPAVGIALSLVLATIFGRSGWTRLLRSIAFGSSGVLAAGSILASATMGTAGLLRWIEWNWSMLTHTDRYGTGDAGMFNVKNLLTAWSDLALSTGGRFPAALCAIVVATIWFLSIRRSRPHSVSSPVVMTAIAVLFGLLINLFGLLKHYSDQSQHYALPVVVGLAVLVALLTQFVELRSWRFVVALVMAVFTAANVLDTRESQVQQRAVAKDVIEDGRVIDALPLENDEIRVWGYFSAVRAGVMPLVAQYAGSKDVSRILNGGSSTDTAPNLARKSDNWRYAIFPKRHFPTESVVRKKYKTHFDFATTDFEIDTNDEIVELQSFFVLENK